MACTSLQWLAMSRNGYTSVGPSGRNELAGHEPDAKTPRLQRTQQAKEPSPRLGIGKSRWTT
eukprot:3576812-Alexandrium_andersonii.AAC.1